MKYLVFIFLVSTSCACVQNPNAGDSYAANDEKYLIAYNVLTNAESDDYDIFTISPDSKEKQNITQDPDVAWVYSGGYDKVLFISDRDTCYRCFFLYEMDSNGKNIRQITDFKLRDSWMDIRKNGEEFIVNPHPSVDSVFYIINRKGDILKKVDSGLKFARDPAFSPDGKLIAFRGANKKSKKEEGFIDEIYLMDENGNQLRQLTNYPVSDTTAAWYAYKAGPPRWHPKEDFISYASFQNGKYSLYGVSVDGQKQWKLTENNQNEVYHDWSPDGQWLVTDLSDPENDQYHIGLIHWQTKDLRILTDSSFQYQQAPVFIKIYMEN